MENKEVILMKADNFSDNNIKESRNPKKNEYQENTS